MATTDDLMGTRYRTIIWTRSTDVRIKVGGSSSGAKVHGTKQPRRHQTNGWSGPELLSTPRAEQPDRREPSVSKSRRRSSFEAARWPWASGTRHNGREVSGARGGPDARVPRAHTAGNPRTRQLILAAHTESYTAAYTFGPGTGCEPGQAVGAGFPAAPHLCVPTG